MLRNSRSSSIGRILTIFTIVLVVSSSGGAEIIGQAKPVAPSYAIDFASYRGGPVDEWLKTHNYTFERDAKNRSLLGLSITETPQPALPVRYPWFLMAATVYPSMPNLRTFNLAPTSVEGSSSSFSPPMI
jgi:hypothetical protein